VATWAAMLAKTARALALVAGTACLVGCPASGVVPREGDYDSVPPEGRVIFRVKRGVWSIPGDNIDCQATLRGTTLQLDCHQHKISARWAIAPDGTVSTDVLDVIYGERDPGMRTYRAR